MWLRCCGAVYDRVGDVCGWWRARSAVLFPVTPDPWVVVCCVFWLVFPGAGFWSWGVLVKSSWCFRVSSVCTVGRWRGRCR